MFRRVCLLTAAVIAAALVAQPVAAGSTLKRSVAVRADLDGRPIGIRDIASYHCHDFDFPVIHCFRTDGELQSSTSAALATRQAQSMSAMDALTANDYVTIYQYSGFQGPSMDLSQDYTGLFAIGWNDAVSSYRARNGYSGTFYSEWFGGGAATDFCCYASVSALSASKDNTFSSVYRH
jgi:hypothetical protein